jgi:hypothetical protein
MMKRALSLLAALLLAGIVAAGAAPASAGTVCTVTNSGCGPYYAPKIAPMSNGYNTYVGAQDVGENTGTTNTLTVTNPGNWSDVSNDAPLGYTGVQTFLNVQQLFNNWGVKGWNCQPAPCTDTPLSALSALQVRYSETSPTDANSIYEFAPDVWDSQRPSDVMFWADTSPVRCDDNGLNSSDILGQAILSGQNWTVYHYGTEIMFILDGTTSTDPVTTDTCAQQASGTIHILAGFRWLLSHGLVRHLGKIGQLNTGWEITSSDGTQFTMSHYKIVATVKP